MTSFEVLRLGTSCLAAAYVVGFFWARWTVAGQNFIDWLIQREGRMRTVYRVLGVTAAVTILGAMWVA